MIKRLPENERDPYLSWDDFNRLVDHSWWLKDVITMMYYSGMRFGEVIGLRSTSRVFVHCINDVPDDRGKGSLSHGFGGIDHNRGPSGPLFSWRQGGDLFGG